MESRNPPGWQFGLAFARTGSFFSGARLPVTLLRLVDCPTQKDLVAVSLQVRLTHRPRKYVRRQHRRLLPNRWRNRLFAMPGFRFDLRCPIQVVFSCRHHDTSKNTSDMPLAEIQHNRVHRRCENKSRTDPGSSRHSTATRNSPTCSAIAVSGPSCRGRIEGVEADCVSQSLVNPRISGKDQVSARSK